MSDTISTENNTCPPISTTDAEHKSSRFSFSVLFELIVKLSIPASAILALAQYYDAHQDTKKERSLSFVREWVNKGNTDRYNNIARYVETKLKELKTPLPQKMPETLLQTANRNLGRKWSEEILISKPELQNDIEKIILFFSRLSICSSSKLCDQNLLHRYFDNEVMSFWSYFSAYAELRREQGYTGFGSHVDHFYTQIKSNK